MPFPKGALHPSGMRADYVRDRDAQAHKRRAKYNAKRRKRDVEAGAVVGERALRSPPPYVERTQGAKRGDHVHVR